MTKFEATMTLLSLVCGMLGTLTLTVWKARGWVDELKNTDLRMAKAIEELTATMAMQYKETQRRLARLERQRDSGAHPRPQLPYGYPRRD